MLYAYRIGMKQIALLMIQKMAEEGLSEEVSVLTQATYNKKFGLVTQLEARMDKFDIT